MFRIDAQGELRLEDTTIAGPNGVRLSPDEEAAKQQAAAWCSALQAEGGEKLLEQLRAIPPPAKASTSAAPTMLSADQSPPLTSTSG